MNRGHVALRIGVVISGLGMEPLHVDTKSDNQGVFEPHIYRLLEGRQSTILDEMYAMLSHQMRPRLPIIYRTPDWVR